MKKRISRQHFVVFATLVTIAALFCGYYFSYIPYNQKQIDERNFRVLTNLNVNAVKKSDTFINNAKVSARNALSELAFLYTNKQPGPAPTGRNFLDSFEALNQHEKLRKLNHRVQLKEFNHDIQFTDFQHIRVDDFDKKDQDLIDEISSSGGPDLNIQIASLQQINLDKNESGHPNANSDIGTIELADLNGELKLRFKDSLRIILGDSVLSRSMLSEKRFFSYTFEFNIQDFFRPLLRKDVFENFLVASGSELIYQSFPGIKLAESDSILTHFYGLETSTIRDIEVGGIPYKAFLQPINLHSHDWVIGGLVPTSLYDKQSNSVPAKLVFLVTISLLLLVLGIPFIKLKIMSQNERLNLSDIVLSVVSLIFGTMLISVFILYIHSNHIKNDSNWDFQFNLENLSITIEGNLDRELEKVLSQIGSYESLLDDYITFYRESEFDFVNLNSRTKWLLDPIALRTNFLNSNKKASGFFRYSQELTNSLNFWNDDVTDSYSCFEQIIWIDSNGDQAYKWSNYPKITPHINVKNREYFKAALNNSGWLLPNSSRRFYLQSVSSLTTGKKKALIASKTPVLFVSSGLEDAEKPVVTSMATELYSIIDPVMPDGYGFAIIDNVGNVIFHSNKDRNLQENLIEECSSDQKLTESIFSRNSNSFEAKYHGKDHAFFSRPLWNSSLTLVTFIDLYDYSAARTQSISYTLVMFTVLCLLFFIQLLIISLTQHEPTRLNFQRFKFAWLWPKSANQRRYLVVLIWTWAVIFQLLTAIYWCRDNATVVFMILIIPFYVCPTIYFYLNQRRLKTLAKGKVKTVLACISPLSIIMVAVLIALGVDKIDLPWWFLLTLLIPLLSILFPSLKILTFRSTPSSGSSSLTKLLTLVRMERAVSAETQSNNNRRRSAPEHRTYTMMLLSWVILVAIIPPTFFYVSAHQQETELIVKKRQLEYVSDIDKRDAIVSGQFGDLVLTEQPLSNRFRKVEDLVSDTLSKEKIIPEDIYTLASDNIELIDSINFRNHHAGSDSISWNLDIVFRWLYHNIRAAYSQRISNMTDLIWNQPTDIARTWESTSDSNIVLEISSNQTTRRIQSSVQPLNFSSFGVDSTIFWFTVIIGLLLLYGAIRFLIKSIFLLNQLNFVPYEWPEIEGLLNSTKDNDIQNNSSNQWCFFLIGEPFSGKSGLLSEMKNATRVDLYSSLNQPQQIAQFEYDRAISSKSDTVIVQHFEHRIKDKDANAFKLELIEGLITANKKVILVSTLDLFHLFEQYNSGSAADNMMKDRWRIAVGGFSKIFVPLKRFKSSKSPKGVELEPRIWKLIERECSHGEYLYSLKDQLVTHALKFRYPRSEDVILRLQSIAQSYYHVLWSSCTAREKFLLYDLAEDGFINNKNSYTIHLLMKKGLLVNHGGEHIQIMNKSFKNFILSIVKRNDALRIELDEANKGSWSMFRTPLLLVLVAVALFIYFSRQDSFNTIVTFTGTLSAALLAGFRLFSAMTSINSKPNLPQNSE